MVSCTVPRHATRFRISWRIACNGLRLRTGHLESDGEAASVRSRVGRSWNTDWHEGPAYRQHKWSNEVPRCVTLWTALATQILPCSQVPW